MKKESKCYCLMSISPSARRTLRNFACGLNVRLIKPSLDDVHTTFSAQIASRKLRIEPNAKSLSVCEATTWVFAKNAEETNYEPDSRHPADIFTIDPLMFARTLRS